MIDSFADIKILRYHVDGFESLPLRRKMLLYHLSEAALWGRDIYWHQNCKDGLALRRLLEPLYVAQKKNGVLDARLEEYVKRVWFANSPYHHYSNDKFTPLFTQSELEQWLKAAGMDDKLLINLQNLFLTRI